MSKRDYYEILQVEKTVTEDGLKKAYRRLAVQFHPDRNPGDKTAEEKFKEINEAYQVLSDANKKNAYDRFGHQGLGGMGGFEQGFGGASFTDIFDNIFGDLFNQGGGGGQSSGVDLRYQMEISFEEAALGVEKEIKFEKDALCETCEGSGAKAGTKPKTCKTCKGAGQVRFNQGFFTLSRTCSACMGRGSVVEEKCESCRGRGKNKKATNVQVKIPAGIDNEQRLRLRGEGEISEPGGRPGDLYVVVFVKDHPLFKREGEHLLLDLPISFVQAALGTEVEIPTLGGTTQIKLAAGIQHGELKRLRSKGIARLNGSGFGDLIVRILVETPTRLSGKQKELLQEFEKESSKECQPGIASFLQKFKEIFSK